jgi:hypothetical protein
MSFTHPDTQHNDTQHSGTQRKGTQHNAQHNYIQHIDTQRNGTFHIGTQCNSFQHNVTRYNDITQINDHEHSGIRQTGLRTHCVGSQLIGTYLHDIKSNDT